MKVRAAHFGEGETTGGAALPAVVVHVNSAGPVVYVELERLDDGSRFRAQLTL